MGRSSDITSRIERLYAALERAKKLDAGTILESKPMSDLLGFTWTHVRGWCDDNPSLQRPEIFTRGGNGIRWQFKAAAFIEALLDLFQEEAKNKGVANARLRKKLGVELPESEHTASLDETKSLISMTMTILSAAKEMNAFVPRQEVADFIEGYNSRLVSRALGTRTRMDPNGRKMTSGQIVELDAEIRSFMVEMNDEATKFVKEQREGIGQSRVAGDSFSPRH